MDTSDDDIVYNTRLVEVNSYFKKSGESNNDFSFENSSDVLAKVRKASLKSLSIRNEFEDITNRNNELFFETRIEKNSLTTAGLSTYQGFERTFSFGDFSVTSYWRIIGHPSYGFLLVIMLESESVLKNISLEDPVGDPIPTTAQKLDNEVMVCSGPIADPTGFGIVSLNVGIAITDVNTTSLFQSNPEIVQFGRTYTSPGAPLVLQTDSYFRKNEMNGIEVRPEASCVFNYGFCATTSHFWIAINPANLLVSGTYHRGAVLDSMQVFGEDDLIHLTATNPSLTCDQIFITKKQIAGVEIDQTFDINFIIDDGTGVLYDFVADIILTLEDGHNPTRVTWADGLAPPPTLTFEAIPVTNYEGVIEETRIVTTTTPEDSRLSTTSTNFIFQTYGHGPIEVAIEPALLDENNKNIVLDSTNSSISWPGAMTSNTDNGWVVRSNDVPSSGLIDISKVSNYGAIEQSGDPLTTAVNPIHGVDVFFVVKEAVTFDTAEFISFGFDDANIVDGKEWSVSFRKFTQFPHAGYTDPSLWPNFVDYWNWSYNLNGLTGNDDDYNSPYGTDEIYVQCIYKEISRKGNIAQCMKISSNGAHPNYVDTNVLEPGNYMMATHIPIGTIRADLRKDTDGSVWGAGVNTSFIQSKFDLDAGKMFRIPGPRLQSDIAWDGQAAFDDFNSWNLQYAGSSKFAPFEAPTKPANSHDGYKAFDHDLNTFWSTPGGTNPDYYDSYGANVLTVVNHESAPGVYNAMNIRGSWVEIEFPSVMEIDQISMKVSAGVVDIMLCYQTVTGDDFITVIAGGESNGMFHDIASGSGDDLTVFDEHFAPIQAKCVRVIITRVDPSRDEEKINDILCHMVHKYNGNSLVLPTELVVEQQKSFAAYGMLDFIPHFHDVNLLEWIPIYVSPSTHPSNIEVDGHFFATCTPDINQRAMFSKFPLLFSLDNVVVRSRSDDAVIINQNYDDPACMDYLILAGPTENSIKIPTGNYDVPQLMQALVDAFAVVAVTMSWSGGTNGQPLTITTTPAINLYNTSPSTLSYNPMAYALGIIDETNFQSPVTLGVPPHIVPLDAIYLRSKELCFQSSTSLIQGGNINYPVFSIVRLNGSGSWVDWFDVFDGEFSVVFQRPTNLQSMNFQITDQLGNMVDFVGDINIVLEITHEV